jgi:hypothetical protein
MGQLALAPKVLLSKLPTENGDRPRSLVILAVFIAGDLLDHAGKKIERYVNGPISRHGCIMSQPSNLLFPTLRWIDDNTLANDAVYRLPVDIGPNQFEFQRVISGQRLAGNSVRP